MNNLFDYQNLIDSGAMPITIAVVLGLISVVSPCPLTTNISALSYISKDIANGKKMILNGALYVLGKVITYGLLGAIAIYIVNRGMSVDGINDFINTYGGKVLPPVLLIMAVLTFKPNLFHKHKKGECECGCSHKKRYEGSIGAFVMGLIFALAFCPINGVFFFGILVPASASAGLGGYLLPVLYGFITAVPVLIILYIIKFGVGKIDNFKDNMAKVEKWVRYGVSVLLVIFAIQMTIHQYQHATGTCDCGHPECGHTHTHTH